MAKQMNIEAIAEHFVKLEETFGTDEFAKAYADIQADTRMKAPELKKLANMFAKAPISHLTSKTKALKAIWGRHTSLTLARDKAAATGGRTAA